MIAASEGSKSFSESKTAREDGRSQLPPTASCQVDVKLTEHRKMLQDVELELNDIVLVNLENEEKEKAVSVRVEPTS